MPDQHIRVDVVRSGGFAGITRTGSADSAALDQESAARLRQIVEQSELLTKPSEAAPSRRPDGFQYDITVTCGDETRSAVLHDPLPEAHRQLVRLVLSGGRIDPHE
jgi:hypothetical protein